MTRVTPSSPAREQEGSTEENGGSTAPGAATSTPESTESTESTGTRSLPGPRSPAARVPSPCRSACSRRCARGSG